MITQQALLTIELSLQHKPLSIEYLYKQQQKENPLFVYNFYGTSFHTVICYALVPHSKLLFSALFIPEADQKILS